MVWSTEEESRRLAQRFERVNNRAEFARTHGVPGGAAMIYQHINGLRPISLEAAKAYAQGFGVPLEEISPRLARNVQSAVDLGVSAHIASEPPPAYPTLQPILAWEHEEDLPEGEFVLVRRLDVHLSAGAGREQVVIEFAEKTPIAFRADWIRKKHLKPSKIAAMTASGDSMEDRIYDGDLLAVDTSQRDVVDGKIYALWYDGGERVKRLYRMPGGGLRIHSDNRDKDKHPDIVLRPEELEHVRIIGRVVHIAGEGGL